MRASRGPGAILRLRALLLSRTWRETDVTSAAAIPHVCDAVEGVRAPDTCHLSVA